MKIKVKVKPKSKQPGLDKIGESEFQVKVRSTAEQGRANQEMIKVLADYFHLPQKAIKIISGATSRKKLVEISG